MILKVAIVLFVIVVGAFYVNPDNWDPFAPYGYTGISFFGKTLLGQTGPGGEPLGMLAGAAVIFFAYIGFDSVSTHAEEAKNPQRDVPIGIITSLSSARCSTSRWRPCSRAWSVRPDQHRDARCRTPSAGPACPGRGS